MEVVIRLVVEAKDEYYPEDAPGPLAGSLPQRRHVASYVSDLLADSTRRDREIGWRVTAVLPARDREHPHA